SAKKSVDAHLAALDSSTSACFAKKVQLLGTPSFFSPSTIEAISRHGHLGALPAPRLLEEYDAERTALSVSWELKGEAAGKVEYAVQIKLDDDEDEKATYKDCYQ